MSMMLISSGLGSIVGALGGGFISGYSEREYVFYFLAFVALSLALIALRINEQIESTI